MEVENLEGTGGVDIAPAETEGSSAPEVTLEALQTELANAKQELDKWQKEAKAHQKTASKKAQEAQGINELRESIKLIQAQNEALVEYLSQDKSDEDFTETKRKPISDIVQAKTSSIQTAAQKAQQASTIKIAQEIQSLIQPKGLQFDDSDELTPAFKLWAKGDIEGALEKTKEIVEKMAEAKETKKPEVDVDKLVEEKAAAIVKAKLIELGVLDTETGQPKSTSSALSRKSLSEYNPIGKTPEQIIKDSEDILDKFYRR